MKEKFKEKKHGRYLLFIAFALVTYYLLLPPLNLTDPTFYVYLFVLIVFGGIVMLPGIVKVSGDKFVFNKKTKGIKIFSSLVGIVVLLILLINVINSPFFNAKAYANRIEVNNKTSFVEDVAPVNFKALPLLDKASSRKLGDRVMGQMPELVSQFVVSNLYTQINYNDDIIRVTPLEYATAIKFFTNQKEGVKGYISVNSVSGEAKLTKLEKGMQILPSALFGKDLYRYLRFKYPTLIFDKETFEIDNEGNPYWIVPIVKYVGVGLRKEITGVIQLDPISGQTTRYNVNDIPTWIDHVYEARLIIEQFDDYGLYINGFWNSLFGQKGVVQTTDGYNYTIMNDDVYLYTGVTSISSDEANLGFILTNLRTKVTNFYPVPGAEEYSAMASAEGQVQQMNYIASFPLLINLNNRPTYLISLKDNAGLVKMYAFVDVVDYQKVVVSDAAMGIEKAANRFLEGFEPSVNQTEATTKNITISTIKTAMVEGNTFYYLIDSNNQKYRIALKINEALLPFLKVDDKVKVAYRGEKELIELTEISNEK